MEEILKDRDGIDWNRVPQPGDEVYSLIWVDDFHVFLGRHVHSERLTVFPGNMPRIPLSAESPSRAYLKIEEAFCRFKPALEAGMRALEVGCAPGGATTAMLKRGLSVTGVDPQRMDEAVAASPAFSFIRKPARFLTPADLAGVNPDLLVMDMSIAPTEAINELAHVISLLRGNFGRQLRLRQGFLTLKLTDWKLAAEIPSYLKRLEALGFHGLRPIQLCSNRQEFFVWSSRFK
jgi:23S rRNA (cytidine2498-2'-O)-methyltransferase